MNAPTLLHRLEASQTASDSTVSLDSAIESAIRDLRRIERSLIWSREPAGEFMRRRLRAIASRLLQAAIAPEIEAAIELPCDVEPK